VRTVFVSALIDGSTVYRPQDYVEIPQVGDVLVIEHGLDMLQVRVDCRIWYQTHRPTLLCVPIGHAEQSPPIPTQSDDFEQSGTKSTE
tara:strand:- start:80 stop:343 length:264 start_codon:yes stop_codon:yes gene_type:complete